jgi:hypothetical protein
MLEDPHTVQAQHVPLCLTVRLALTAITHYVQVLLHLANHSCQPRTAAYLILPPAA